MRRRFVLPGVAAGLVLCSGAALAQDVDAFVNDRRACREAHLAGRIDEAFDCIDDLWTSHGAEMDVPGKIRTLQQMAELYLSTRQYEDARGVYEFILSQLDNSWRPESFEYQPTAWRQVFVDAQHRLNITGSSPGIRNIALLDFIVTSLGDDGSGIEAMERSVPLYVTTRLQQLMEEHPLAGTDSALAIVPSRARARLLGDLAEAAGRPADQPIGAEDLPPDVIARIGRLHAVHAFINGTILATGGDEVVLALQMVPVENVRVSCPVTRTGSTDALLALLADALDELMTCAFDYAHGDELASYMGPIQESAVAYQHLHRALVCQEKDDMTCAFEEALEAARLLPEDEGIRRVIEGLEYQREKLSMESDVTLPSRPDMDASDSG